MSTALMVLATLVVFGACVALGAIVLVSVAVRREEKSFSLGGQAPDWVTRGARRLTGIWLDEGRERA